MPLWRKVEAAERSMKSKLVLISILLTLCAGGLYQLVYAGRDEFPSYSASAGQIADFDLSAPFDFPVLKSEEQLEKEFQQALMATGKTYSLDPDVEFAAISNLNRLYDMLYEAHQSKDWEAAKVSARRLGFTLSDASRNLVTDSERLSGSYDTIKDALMDIYRVGVYANINADSILVLEDTGSRRQNLARFYHLSQAQRLLTGRFSGGTAILARDNASILVKPNLLVNNAAYDELKRELRAKLNPIAGEVLQNEIIVSKNQRLSDDQINKLRSLARAYRDRGITRSGLNQWLNIMGFLLYVFLLALALNAYAGIRLGAAGSQQLNLYVLNLGVLLLMGLAAVNSITVHWSVLFLPVSLLALAIALLGGFGLGMMFSLCSVLMLGPLLNWEVTSLLTLLLPTLITLVSLRQNEARPSYARIWLVLLAALVATLLIGELTNLNPGDLRQNLIGLVRKSGTALVTSTISVLLCMAIVGFFERRWNRATKQVLLELLDFNHPLLKKLATNAEGTYHHSLIVGNLAERAAEEIGANPLLARVGSYYHDVGKLVAPQIFTENNENSGEYHSRLSPGESAELIRNHVREGVVLAEKHRLPTPIVDIIDQHHGNSYIRYFLDQAEKNGSLVDPAAFRYHSPLPKTREAALVMIADVIESTSKAKSGLSDEELRKIVEETILRLIRDGQLDDADISTRDLCLAREAMLPILTSIYRKRLEYPEELSGATDNL